MKFLQGHPIADEQGWVKPDRSTLQVKGYTNIGALGDTTDLPTSKAGSIVHFEVPIVVEWMVACLRCSVPDPKHTEYQGLVMCFLETGQSMATMFEFDYEHPPKVRPPSHTLHYEKMLFNKA